MRVSTQFPIAVQALLMIAYFPNIRVTSEMVAESVGNNPVIIRKIYSKLKKENLLTVQRGAGDTALAKPASEITLWDVYVAVESEDIEDIFKFPDTLSGACPIGGSIEELLTIHLKNAVDALKDEMSKVTIEELKQEIEMKQQRKIDFPAIVEWYKENGFDS